MTTPETEVQETPQDTQVVEPEIAPDATPEAEPEGEAPDYQALYKEAKETAEKADQRARSIEGSVKSRREQDALIQESVTEARKARQLAELSLEQQSNPDLDTSERMAAISSEEDRMTFTKYVNETAEWMDAEIERSGIDRNNPAIVEAVSIWNTSKDDQRAAFSLLQVSPMVTTAIAEHERTSSEEKMKVAREEGETEGRKRRERADATDLGTVQGSGGGPTDAEVWKRYGDGDPRITRQEAETAGRNLGLRD